MFITALIIFIVLLLFFVLGVQSQSKKSPSLVNGRLSKCSYKPNCVCSEYENDKEHYIEPIIMKNNDLTSLKIILQKMGGVIQFETDRYLFAKFTSHWFSFVDDVEVRFDENNQLAHIRSASRVGRSDMGVNRKRMKQLKELYSTWQKNHD